MRAPLFIRTSFVPATVAGLIIFGCTPAAPGPTSAPAKPTGATAAKPATEPTKPATEAPKPAGSPAAAAPTSAPAAAVAASPAAAAKPTGGPAANVPPPPNGQKVVLKISHNQQPTTPPAQALEMFKKAVDERTNGYYDVQVFPGQQLGSLRDQVEGVKLGTIEATQQTPSTIALFVPKVGVLDFPFLWPSDEAVMWKTLDGPLGQELLQSLEAGGFKGADFWASGFKNITTGKTPVRSPADLKGMKIRIIPGPLLSAQYEAWGATPTPVDFSELYTALQQGLVDGQENPPGTIVDVKLFEVQKYMTESRHGFLHYIMLFNKKWWDDQPKVNQEILTQALKEAGQWERQAMQQRDADATKRIEGAGVQAIQLTPEAREQFRQLSQPVHDKFSDQVGKDYLERLKAELAKGAR